MRVIPPNVVLFLTGHVRRLAAAEQIDVDVTNKEPADLELPLRRPLIVLRDDGGPRLDWTTFDRSIGASVLAGSKRHDAPAIELASWLASVLHDDELPEVEGSPIASVEFDGCNGPTNAAEVLDVTRMYLTAQYVATGSWPSPAPTDPAATAAAVSEDGETAAPDAHPYEARAAGEGVTRS
ncbi:hypothetical protein [Microbacterium sp. IEGM 1404]|uniref:hypothetical protein n=1 Tax=Microbacterium sp. IEGM 1404 TaxID=3047084 RepID=UPI0024B7DE66|nr:hypothetical protein [Microbacterium sp. IEGM 1404]MDI9889973.1 hypothetical protein [Microbacterium sp. IEGM 1404]